MKTQIVQNIGLLVYHKGLFFDNLSNFHYKKNHPKGGFMHPMIGPIISIIAGVLVLVYPKILNYVVAVYLIVFGIVELLHRA
jgi:uncharacterized membrane protein HdeD (DUF308 family)